MIERDLPLWKGLQRRRFQRQDPHPAHLRDCGHLGTANDQP